MRDIQQVFASSNAHKGAAAATSTIDKRTEDLDLIEVVAYIAKITWKYKRILLTGLAIGLITGIGASQLFPPTFQKEMVSSIPSLDKDALSTILLEFEMKAKRAPAGSELRDLIDLELETNAPQQSVTPVPFVIVGKFSDETHVLAIQKQLIAHIEANPFVKSKMEAENDRMLRTVSMLKADEQQITALLRDANNLKSESFSVADMAKLKMDFYKERMDLEARLKTFSAVSIIQSFTGKNPPFIKRVVYTVVGFIVFAMFVACVIVACKEVKLEIDERERRLAVSQNGFNVSRNKETAETKKVSAM